MTTATGITIPDNGSTTEYIDDPIGGWQYIVTTTVNVQQRNIASIQAEIASLSTSIATQQARADELISKLAVFQQHVQEEQALAASPDQGTTTRDPGEGTGEQNISVSTENPGNVVFSGTAGEGDDAVYSIGEDNGETSFSNNDPTRSISLINHEGNGYQAKIIAKDSNSFTLGWEKVGQGASVAIRYGVISALALAIMGAIAFAAFNDGKNATLTNSQFNPVH